MIDITTTFALDASEEVSCYYCMQEYGTCLSYQRGEAVLADAGHPPYNGEANFICMRHLIPNASIFDPTDNFRVLTHAEYMALGRPEIIKEHFLYV